MIPRVSIPPQAPVTGRVSALVRDILRAWIAHHQRLADLGTSRFL